MKHVGIIKRIAGILFFLTFFLPLSQCQKNQTMIDITDTGATTQRAMTDVSEAGLQNNTSPEYTYNIPLEFFLPSDPYSYFILMAFIWPLLFWAYLALDKRPRSIILVNAMEPLACIGSGYVSWSIAFLGDILFWGYLSLISIVVYFLSSIYELFKTAMMRLNSRP